MMTPERLAAIKALVEGYNEYESGCNVSTFVPGLVAEIERLQAELAAARKLSAVWKKAAKGYRHNFAICHSNWHNAEDRWAMVKQELEQAKEGLHKLALTNRARNEEIADLDKLLGECRRRL